MFNQLLEEYGGDDVEDDERTEINDEIEVLLEYLLSIATASRIQQRERFQLI